MNFNKPFRQNLQFQILFSVRQEHEIFIHFMIKLIGMKIVLCSKIKMALEKEIVLA